MEQVAWTDKRHTDAPFLIIGEKSVDTWSFRRRGGSCLEAVVERVEWTEKRHTDEPFLMIGEKSSGAWSFWQRSSWELGWYPVSEKEDRRRRARISLAEALLLNLRADAHRSCERCMERLQVEPALEGEAA